MVSDSIYFCSFLGIFSIYLILIPYCASLIYYTEISFNLKTTSNFLGKKPRWDNLSILPITSYPLLIAILFYTSGGELTLLFGHMTISSSTLKIQFALFSLSIFLVVYTFFTKRFVNKSQIDVFFLISVLIFFSLLLFNTTSLLSFIFLLELLTLIFFIILAPSSLVFSARLPYSVQIFNLRSHSPFDSLFFFFWTSFLVSIGFFYFFLNTSLNGIIATFNSWEYFLTDATPNATNATKATLSLLALLLTLFLKSGLVPFFFWKPIFFSNLPLCLLLFYIVFFYFLILLWFSLLISSIPPHLTKMVITPVFTLLLASSLLLFPLLNSNPQFKLFFAISSIFNTLVVWLALFSG